MSILISGMEMPTSCRMCPLLQHITADYDHEPFWYCALDNFKKSITPHPMTLQEIDNNRHRNCPLVPVPEHGRLIDADALNFKDVDLCGNHYLYMNEIRKVIEAAPTIVGSDMECQAKEGER